MVQKQSWDGQITKWYEDNLKLKGGYARRLNVNEDSSVQNSEYVISTPYTLTIVARSGRKITPEKDLKRNIVPHYHHPYGSDKSATEYYERIVKAPYERKIKMIQKMQRRK